MHPHLQLASEHYRVYPPLSQSSVTVFFFFFQAEDGIRDDLVTGVQTCALPISQPNTNRVVLQTSTILDGKGGVLRNQQIVIEGSRIQSVQAGTLPATYD